MKHKIPKSVKIFDQDIQVSYKQTSGMIQVGNTILYADDHFDNYYEVKTSGSASDWNSMMFNLYTEALKQEKARIKYGATK